VSPKQEIYQELLRPGLVHWRNRTTQPWWRRLRYSSELYESELIHNLWPSLWEPEFVEHDIWFLNTQARWYCEKCSPKLSPLYEHRVGLIRELFALVPEALRDKLQWNGPA
jgi:hypothetical protein